MVTLLNRCMQVTFPRRLTFTRSKGNKEGTCKGRFWLLNAEYLRASQQCLWFLKVVLIKAIMSTTTEMHIFEPAKNTEAVARLATRTQLAQAQHVKKLKRGINLVHN